MGPAEGQPMGEPMPPEPQMFEDEQEDETPLDLEEIMEAIRAGCTACAESVSSANSQAFERYAQGVWHLSNALAALTSDPDPPEPRSDPAGSSQKPAKDEG